MLGPQLLYRFERNQFNALEESRRRVLSIQVLRRRPLVAIVRQTGHGFVVHAFESRRTSDTTRRVSRLSGIPRRAAPTIFSAESAA